MSLSSLVIVCPRSVLAGPAWEQINVAYDIFDAGSRGGAPLVTYLLPQVEKLRVRAYASLQASMGRPSEIDVDRANLKKEVPAGDLGPNTHLSRRLKQSPSLTHKEVEGYVSSDGDEYSFGRQDVDFAALTAATNPAQYHPQTDVSNPPPNTSSTSYPFPSPTLVGQPKLDTRHEPSSWDRASQPCSSFDSTYQPNPDSSYFSATDAQSRSYLGAGPPLQGGAPPPTSYYAQAMYSHSPQASLNYHQSHVPTFQSSASPALAAGRQSVPPGVVGQWPGAGEVFEGATGGEWRQQRGFSSGQDDEARYEMCTSCIVF